MVSRLSCSDDQWSRYGLAIKRLSELSSNWYDPQNKQAQTEDIALGVFLADWSFQALTFVRGYLQAQGCAREAGRGSILVWIGWHDAAIAQATLAAAVRLLEQSSTQHLSCEKVQHEVARLW